MAPKDQNQSNAMLDSNSAASAPGPDSTRDRILNAAMDLFHRQGYAATGIAQILKAADAKSGSLYHCFPTKEDLLIATLERRKELLWPELIDPVLARVNDPVEQVFGILDGYRKMLEYTACTMGCPVGNIALELADHLPGVRERCAALFDGWRDAVLDCLRRAGHRFPSGTDLGKLASFVLTVMEGGVMQARVHRNVDAFESAVESLREYFEMLMREATHWDVPAGRAPHVTAKNLK